MFYEEIGELMSVINKCERGRVSQLEVIEEIADVEIMLQQLKIMYACCTHQENYKQYLKIKNHKLNRLNTRLHQAHYKQLTLK